MRMPVVTDSFESFSPPQQPLGIHPERSGERTRRLPASAPDRQNLAGLLFSPTAPRWR